MPPSGSAVPSAVWYDVLIRRASSSDASSGRTSGGVSASRGPSVVVAVVSSSSDPIDVRADLNRSSSSPERSPPSCSPEGLGSTSSLGDSFILSKTD